MYRLQQALARGAGVITTAELNRYGLYHLVPKALDAGVLRRLRQGVYAHPGDLSPTGIARALGGTLTCLSVLEGHNIWVPRSGELHIRLPRSRARDTKFIQRYAPTATIHTLDMPMTAGSVPAVDSVPAVLQCAQRCCSRDELVAVLEGMLRAGFGPDQLQDFTRDGNARLREAAELAEYGSDSGVETLVRLRLRALRLRVRTQVREQNWFIDLLVGDWLAIEVDGYSHHRDRREFVRDRRKDRALLDAGFHLRRFSYDDVMFDWPTCEAEILRLVRARVHLRPNRGRLA